VVPYFNDLKDVVEGQINEEIVAPFNEEKIRYIDRYNAAKAHYDNIIGKYNQAKDKVKEAEEYYKQTHENQPPPAKLHNNVLWLALASIVLMVVELPINIVAFRLFYEAEIMTWIMALSPGVALILAGDLLGWELKREKKQVILLILAAFLFLAAVAFSVFLGIVRGEYMATIAKEEGGSVPIAGNLWWGFVVLNVIFFVVAAFLSWRFHDESYQTLYVAKKEYERLSKMKEKAETELDNSFNAYRDRFKHYKAKAEALKNTAEHLMDVYMEANLYHRKDEASPIAFQDDHLPKIDLDIFKFDDPPPIYAAPKKEGEEANSSTKEGEESAET
jgi:hypothetical protein